MNARQLRIIKILRDSKEPVNSLAISSEIGCSTKTIQGEIKEINKNLENAQIISIRGVGYKLEGKIENINLQELDYYDVDRIEHIIKLLINISNKNINTMKLEDLAETMYVRL